MLQICKRAVLCLFAPIIGEVLTACGGGNSSANSTANDPPFIFPSFVVYRSDFISKTEGQPLHIAPCKYSTIGSTIVGQEQTCNNPALNYPNTNWMEGPAYGAWRISVNAEPSWAADANGPPNQSYPLGANSPVNIITRVDSIDLAISENRDGKIPYLGVNYVRGAQNDPVLWLSNKGGHRVLSFDLTVTASGLQQWAYMWFFFKQPDGERVMILRDLYNTHPPLNQYWNWPATESVYFPGALLVHNPVYHPMGFAFDVQKLIDNDYPAVKDAAFMGFEIAIEKAPGPGGIQARLSNVKYQ